MAIARPCALSKLKSTRERCARLEAANIAFRLANWGATRVMVEPRSKKTTATCSCLFLGLAGIQTPLGEPPPVKINCRRRSCLQARRQGLLRPLVLRLGFPLGGSDERSRRPKGSPWKSTQIHPVFLRVAVLPCR